MRSWQPYGLALAVAKQLACVVASAKLPTTRRLAHEWPEALRVPQPAVETIPALLLPGGVLRGNLHGGGL